MLQVKKSIDYPANVTSNKKSFPAQIHILNAIYTFPTLIEDIRNFKYFLLKLCIKVSFFDCS